MKTITFKPIDLSLENILFYPSTSIDYYHEIQLCIALDTFYGQMEDPCVFYPMFF